MKLRVFSTCFAALAFLAACTQTPKDVTISYPAKAPANWPLFLAQEGGYYKKLGFNTKLEFGAHPTGIAMVISDQALMTNYTLEQAMLAASKDGSLVIVGSPMNSGLFALMANKSIASVAGLKGKKIGVTQIGDAPYNFALAILAKNGLGQRDVEWIPTGTDGGGRVAALSAGRVDATMVPPPAYFKLEAAGFKAIANLADYKDLYAPMSYVFKKTTLQSQPDVVERLIKAHAEAIRRYYDDRTFALEAYAKYDPQGAADVERIYDHDAKDNTYERVPYVLAPAVQYIIDHQPDERVAEQLKGYDFHQVIDNSIVARLVEQGFFRELFGADVKAEEERKAALAYR